MAAGLGMPSHVVDLSRCRSANEYSEGSVFSRQAEEISLPPVMHTLHSTSLRAPCVAAIPKGPAGAWDRISFLSFQRRGFDGDGCAESYFCAGRFTASELTIGLAPLRIRRELAGRR